MFGKKEGSAERPGGFAGLFKKKPDDTTGPAPPKFPSGDPLNGPAPQPPLPGAALQNPNPPEVALLAGRVVDGYYRPTSNTYIRLVNLEGAKDGAAPIDVATSSDGYFTIPNLKSGGQYQLIARTKQGEKLLAGITYTQAPNVRVVIQVKEEFATSSIPPLPTAPSLEKTEKPDKVEKPDRPDAKPPMGSLLDKKDPPAVGWSPSLPNQPSPPSPGPGDIDLPAKVPVPVPVPASAPSSGWPPPLQIGGPKKTTAPPPQPPPLPKPSDIQSGLTPKVPSCVLLADNLQILALSDVDGQTWSFHKDRKGKVVLLDFWTPNCAPCKKAMPILSQLQGKFGPQGLEVIGIAIDSGPVKDQANRAKTVCYQLQTNYRQLLGQNDRTDLCAQFGVQMFPTMILIDDTGRVLWRHVGIPDQATIENVVHKHLASRAF